MSGAPASGVKSYTRVVRTDDGGSGFEDAELRLSRRGHVTLTVGDAPFEALSIPTAPQAEPAEAAPAA